MTTFTPTTSRIPNPGEYHVTRGINRDVITVGCPKCEGEHVLPKFMMVSDGGRVHPEMRCPLFDCGWKGDAVFAGWKART